MTRKDYEKAVLHALAETISACVQTSLEASGVTGMVVVSVGIMTPNTGGVATMGFGSGTQELDATEGTRDEATVVAAAMGQFLDRLARLAAEQRLNDPSVN